MIKDIPWLLLEKHFAEAATDNEWFQVEEWLKSAPENFLIYDQLKLYYQSAGSLPVEFVPNTKLALVNVNKRLTTTHKRKIKPSYFWYAAAASVLICVTFLWLTKNTAIIHSQPLLSILSSDSTTTSVVLADGSHVWLNTGSKLEYPEKFGKTREVALIGEGYFEVAHDPARPFLVKTAENIVKDLGTKFDIRAYQKEPKISVFVTEGKVCFENRHGNQVLLNPGQKTAYSLSDQTFEEISVLDPNGLAWKTKVFVFDNKPLDAVFQTLSDVYHFSYMFNNKALEKRRITTQFKELSLNDIVSIISMATNANITIKTTPKTEVIIK